MDQKKGVELPEREGRWELYLGKVVFSESGQYVVYRRLPDPKPMPTIVVDDGIAIVTSQGRHVRLVVTKPHLHIGADLCGECYRYFSDQILHVWRDGEKIWSRES